MPPMKIGAAEAAVEGGDLLTSCLFWARPRPAVQGSNLAFFASFSSE